MDHEEPKEPLLPGRNSSDSFDYHYARHDGPLQHRSRFAWIIRSLIGFLGLSLVLNGFLAFKYIFLKQSPNICRTKFSGLGYDTPTEYRVHTAYGQNTSESDNLWDTIDSSPIIVALTDKYATSKALDLSARFPWDESKGIYHVKAFHHLHCLKSMRKAFTDLERGNPQIVPTGHFHHCLDTLRQDLMCLADDTPMPTINAIHQIGNGQVRQCRDWNKLIAWTQEPERHACYKMLDDYRKVPHTLEQFDYCNVNSEYAPIVEEYFGKYGHKDPYGD